MSVCSICNKRLSEDHFSRTQLEKPRPRCKICINPPPTKEQLHSLQCSLKDQAIRKTLREAPPRDCLDAVNFLRSAAQKGDKLTKQERETEKRGGGFWVWYSCAWCEYRSPATFCRNEYQKGCLGSGPLTRHASAHQVESARRQQEAELLAAVFPGGLVLIVIQYSYS